MAQIHAEIDEKFMRELRSIIRASDVECVQDGLTILRWAVGEAMQGRTIISCNENGTDPAKLTMRCLEIAKVSAKFS